MRQRLATSGWRSRITSGTRAEPGVGLVDPARMRRHEPPHPSGTTQLAAWTPGGSVPRLRVQAAGPSGTSRAMRRYPSGESSIPCAQRAYCASSLPTWALWAPSPHDPRSCLSAVLRPSGTLDPELSGLAVKIAERRVVSGL